MHSDASLSHFMPWQCCWKQSKLIKIIIYIQNTFFFKVRTKTLDRRAAAKSELKEILVFVCLVIQLYSEMHLLKWGNKTQGWKMKNGNACWLTDPSGRTKADCRFRWCRADQSISQMTHTLLIQVISQGIHNLVFKILSHRIVHLIYLVFGLLMKKQVVWRCHFDLKEIVHFSSFSFYFIGQTII